VPRQIDERIDFLAGPQAERGAAGKEEGDVGAERGAKVSKLRERRPSGPESAAASLLPPPSPACTGIRLSILTAMSRTSPAKPSAFHRLDAARQTRLVSSSGIPGVRHAIENGPRRTVHVIVSCNAIDWNTVRSS
jgi:hypothetical protein